MTNPKKRIIKLIASAVLVVVTAGLLMYFVDTAAWQHWRKVKLPGEIKKTFISFNAYVKLPLILLVWTCLVALPTVRLRWRLVFQLVLVILICAVPVWIGKWFIPRLRPRKFDGAGWLDSFFPAANDLKWFYLESFPSGDAAMAFAITVVLAAYFERYRVILYVLAFGCSISRFVLGYHWPSDIFVGGVIGYMTGRAVMALTGGAHEQGRISS